MNKPLCLAIAILLISGLRLSAQNWYKGSIQGEGEVVRKEVQLPAFKGIDLAFSGNVVLTQGANQKVVIEAQQNIIDNIRLEVSGGTWRISFIKNVKNAKTVNVYITLPSLDYVGLSGSGDIRSSGAFSGLEDLDIAVSGSGDIKMDYKAVNTKARISGSGEIVLTGESGSLDISVSGSGNVRTKDLVSNDCQIYISGSGNADVNVNRDLEVHLSGSGDVRYLGSASVTARISGSGSVRKF